MKILRSVSCVLVVLALAAVGEAQVPRVERPTWRVGDRWLRSDGAWDLVRVENDHRSPRSRAPWAETSIP